MCGLKQGTSNTQLMLLYMIIVKSKPKGILFPTPDLKRSSTDNFYLTSAMENTAINPIRPVSQKPISKLTTGLYRV